MNEMVKIKIESTTEMIEIRLTVSTELLKILKGLVVDGTTKENGVVRYLVKKLVYNELTSRQRTLLFNKELVDVGTTIIMFDDIDVYAIKELLHDISNGVRAVLTVSKILGKEFKVEVVPE